MYTYLLIFIYLCFYTLPKIFLSLSQIKHIKSKLRQKIPNLFTKEEYESTAKYALVKQKSSIFTSIYEFIVFAFFIDIGFRYLLSLLNSTNSITSALLFFVSFFVIYSFLMLPVSYIETFIIDKKFGFTKSSYSLFFKDFAKSLIISVVILIIVGMPIIYFIDNFKLWWFYSFLVILSLVVIANLLYPTLIAPFFNKFTPLEDGELKNKIEDLLAKTEFKSKGVYIVDASTRDDRLNAYFAGFGKSKRVVLFDTILDKISTTGILAILAHEIGHFKNKDIYRAMVVQGVVLFLAFFIAGEVLMPLFARLNLVGSGYLSASLFLSFLFLFFSVIIFYFMPIIGFFSRRAEYGADAFASQLTSNNDLAQALIRLIKENKVFPTSSKIFIFFYFTHPPLLERLKALNYDANQ